MLLEPCGNALSIQRMLKNWQVSRPSKSLSGYYLIRFVQRSHDDATGWRLASVTVALTALTKFDRACHTLVARGCHGECGGSA